MLPATNSNTCAAYAGSNRAVVLIGFFSYIGVVMVAEVFSLGILFLYWESKDPGFMQAPLYSAVCLCAPGLYEESGRLVVFALLMSLAKWRVNPALFGFGYGLCEAMVLILGAFMVLDLSFGNIALVVMERLYVLIAQIGLSMVVFYGVKKGEVVRWLIAAVMLHDILDAGSLAYRAGCISLKYAEVYGFAWAFLIIFISLQLTKRLEMEKSNDEK